MKIRNGFSGVIFVVMLILVKVWVLAGEPQLKEPSKMNSASACPGANTPWINREIDTPPDKDQKVGARMSFSKL